MQILICDICGNEFPLDSKGEIEYNDTGVIKGFIKITYNEPRYAYPLEDGFYPGKDSLQCCSIACAESVIAMLGAF